MALLGTHLRIQDHKKVKFSGQDISSLAVKFIFDSLLVAMLSRPKEGSIGAGTGGYTSGLGSFKDHLGYGSSLFGEGGHGGKSSGMVSPDAAAGQIASKLLRFF